MSNHNNYTLITGGLGFIGSHVAVELMLEKYKIIIIDNLSNSKRSTFDKIRTLANGTGETGETDGTEIIFFEMDLLDEEKLKGIFTNYKIDCVIHMAGFKAVSESIKIPLRYYENNISGTLKLLKIMNETNCKNLIFSSSATVYGDQIYPVDENCPTGINMTNPYGKTKHMIEQILMDLYQSDHDWRIVIFRYFNPVGNHPSGLLKEDPNGLPNNLFPHIIKTARQQQHYLSIFGKDYDTPDGTCIRDFIHVVDLAKGHIAPLKRIKTSGLSIYNLGTGTAVSLMELITCFSQVNKIDIPYQFVERRSGDLPVVFARVDKVYDELGWKAEKSLVEICQDGWKPYIS
jgi:UDP-glucose 4-epimerase